MQYAFANCVLDTELCELRHGNDVVRVRPLVLQVLTYLVEHRDRVVSKQELFEQLWPGRVVGDATLNSCLKEARRAIGDNGREQRLLKTLHGHGYRFIGELVDGADMATTPAGDADPAPPGEREFKTVSVLACRIGNAAELAATIEPEAWDALMQRFRAGARDVIDRYGGTECERQDDGFTALFGAPTALEDHARRATLAALDLEFLRTTDGDNGGAAALELCIGLHTGTVVAGPGEGSALSATGNAIRVTHGIKDIASDVVLASEELFSLIDTDFRGDEIRVASGSNTGMTTLVRVREPTHHRAGVPRHASRKLSPFVGRAEELRILKTRLGVARSGSGHVVCMSGEPGIGKSRLLHEFLRTPRSQKTRVLKANCLAYRQTSPYFPLTQLLRHCCGAEGTAIDRGEPGAFRARAEAAGISADGIDTLLEVLDVGTADAMQREVAPRAGIDEVIAHANRLLTHGHTPTIIAVEDLHWIDSTTEQWLTAFVSRVAGMPALLLLTYRPGYRPEWLSYSHVSQLALPRLNDADSTALIGSLATDLPERADARRQIVINAQGNPFFLEELAFGIAGRDNEAEHAVPTTVQAVLASRVDQLVPEDKALLQTASVIGTLVDYGLLQASTGRAAADVDASIRRLEAAEFVFADAAADRRRYVFKHALTQEVAYQSMLSSGRIERHRRIAAAYESQYPELAETQPEIVARHFTEAGVAVKAMDYWQRAGMRAARRSANPEAVSHFEKALAASESQPVTDELKKRQLEIYLSLGPPLMTSKAFTSPSVEDVYARARDLCNEVGTSSELLTVLWGLWLHYSHRGQIDHARPITHKIHAIASEVGDNGLLLQAHHANWTTEIWHGEVLKAYDNAQAGIRLYDSDVHGSHKYLYGAHDPGVCAFGTAGICAWFIGRPDEALRLARDGAGLAEAIEHPYSRLITVFDFMLVESLRGNPDAAGRYAEIAVRASTEQRAPNYHAVADIFGGYSEACAGDFDIGASRLQDGLVRYRELGAERLLAFYLLLLAEVCTSPEHVADGLTSVDEAEALIRRTKEIRWSAECLRLRGELMLIGSPSDTEVPEALFGEAMDVAAKQNSLSFELRAATSLARLLQLRGRDEQARKILRPVYSRFEEGRDTRDLREADSLLQALA